MEEITKGTQITFRREWKYCSGTMTVDDHYKEGNKTVGLAGTNESPLANCHPVNGISYSGTYLDLQDIKLLLRRKWIEINP